MSATQAGLFDAGEITDTRTINNSGPIANTDHTTETGSGSDGQTPPQAPTQWRLESLQVVNWGGFQGFHQLPFHPDATLLSGGSGTGKSTLLDAYTALMMPSSVAFNGASNDSVVGRARSEAGGQRTLLTYLRGKQGVNDESGGASSDSLLRGDGAATWGAIAATFIDSDRARFSAVRVFFVPASASDVPSITGRMATYPGPVDLNDLAVHMRRHTAGKPLAPLITATWNGAKVYSKYSEFSNTLFTQLAIGANGDGAKALDLLARIQAGRAVNSVNALYRDLVLDTPSTFRNADLALEHFDVLADDLARMIEAEQKHATLRDIREINAELSSARQRAAALDHYGLNQPGTTKLTVWSLRKEEALLDDAEELARTRHRTAEIDSNEAALTAERIWLELEAARSDYREAGGEELSSLDDQINRLSGELSIAEGNREDLAEHAAKVPATVNSRGDFDALQHDAHSFAKRRDAWAANHQRQRDALRDQLKPLEDERRTLRRDIDHLTRSGTRIRANLGNLRDIVAKRLGMSPASLPFLAELIDLRPGQDEWRTAIETVLGGDASRIVIPRERRREIARALNDLIATQQIRLIDGATDLPPRYPLSGADTADQAGRVLGKLQFADHPYAGWVQTHLDTPALNALCVASPDDLDGGGFRVTAKGQVRSGIRSAIGRNSRDNIIGFSSAEEIATLEDELQRVETALATTKTALETLALEDREHNQRRDAYIAILQFRWVDVDTEAIRARLTGLEERQAALRSADDKLHQLSEQIQQLTERHRKSLIIQTANTLTADKLHEAWEQLVDQKDAVVRQLAPHESNDAFDLTPEQEADLAAAYAAVVAHARNEDALAEAERFAERLAIMQLRLREQATSVRSEIDSAEKTLSNTFAQYSSRWPDNNLPGTYTPAAYDDYVRILEELESRGLYETREEWQRSIAQWSGEDLLPLSQALFSEIDAIKARVAPINDILETIPFGPRRGRLVLRVDDIHSESVRQFRQKLRRMTTLATKQMTFEETKKTFHDLSLFMDHLRDPKDPRYNADRADRARLLDVRRHVEVYAVEHPSGADTWQPLEHRQLGTASGGESQELIAFIIGSALRFRLGDELRDWPRFAPVFLDEGFVKADSEFAGRAVSAWRTLGFQIIVGTPEDKFTGLERHMDSFIVVYKDQDTGYSYIDHVTDQQNDTKLAPAATSRLGEHDPR